ncbi:C-factor [Phytophthora citrophthora]|uniref:C-factor n=1 Tax=Phytophthora citrophthora TaxID=4793 RepID=A0AAD9G088_9STRA|nr:C-factor [Phytophthora citrophthora]
MDTSDEASVAEAAAELEGVAIDLVINNAGTGWLADIVEPTKQLLMNAVAVNAVGPFLVTRALQFNLQLAAKINGAASVVRMSSVLSSLTRNTDENAIFMKGQYPYTMSKAALNMITRSLAVDLRESNVAEVAVHPGYVNTELTGGQGLLNPNDVATAIADIVSKVTIKDTGKFLSADPTIPSIELPW